ncbi:MAG: hypothetical protein ACRD29_14370 [Acidimicrobiales bacterium]
MRFSFRFDPRFRAASLPFAVTPRTAYVEVRGGELHVRFGLWSLTTPLDNVADASVTGPYNIVKVIGPARLSFADRGITFATNRDQGVCVAFHRPVATSPPFGWLKHPGATVTVSDPDALLRSLTAS